MRVIAGNFKGRNLKAPKGMGTRPTTDRVKESMFSSLVSAYGSLEGANVLDAFAGSGALGIECASRGATSCTFFEMDREALACVRANVESCKLAADRFRIRQADVLANPPVFGASFDIVLLDPPYATDVAHIVEFVATLADKGMLAPGAVISYEHDAEVDVRSPLEAAFPKASFLVDKTYGKSKTGWVLFSIE